MGLQVHRTPRHGWDVRNAWSSVHTVRRDSMVSFGCDALIDSLLDYCFLFTSVLVFSVLALMAVAASSEDPGDSYAKG